MLTKLRNKIGANGETLFYAVPILIMFALIYFCSLTFRYIEGDDAASVAFHALGRNAALQPPYSAYHGMMDIFLYLLPADEAIIRHAALSITALSAIIAMILMMDLIREWFPDFRGFRAALITVLILLSSPEVFYLGMTYTPSWTALCFVLTAHKFIRRLPLSRREKKSSVHQKLIFILSIALFGIGTACRWDIGAYLIIITVDLILNKPSGGNDWSEGVEMTNGGRIFSAAGFAAAAFVASMIVIFLSGCTLDSLFDFLKLSAKEVKIQNFVSGSVGAYQMFFTPAFLIFFLTGFVWLVLHKSKLPFFIFITILPFLIYLSSREPKMMLPAFPVFYLTAAVGINFLWFRVQKKYLLRVKIALVSIILLPWLVGIKVISPNTSWGPGFEIKTLNASTRIDNGGSLIEDKAQGRTISIQNFKLEFDGGFAIPTGEGQRPLGGHFYTLIGGEWRTLYEKLDQERNLILAKATAEKMSVLQDEGNSCLLTKLLETGYTTKDKWKNYSADGIDDRVFFRENSKIHLETIKIRSSLFEKKIVQKILAANNNKKIILYSGYSSTIRELLDTAPEAIEVLGPFSAVIDLEKFAESDNLVE